MTEYTLKDYYYELRETERLERRMSRMERKVGRELGIRLDDQFEEKLFQLELIEGLKLIVDEAEMSMKTKYSGFSYYFDGLTAREIAIELGVTPSCVRSHYIKDFRVLIRSRKNELKIKSLGFGSVQKFI